MSIVLFIFTIMALVVLKMYALYNLKEPNMIFKKSDTQI